MENETVKTAANEAELLAHLMADTATEPSFTEADLALARALKASNATMERVDIDVAAHIVRLIREYDAKLAA